MTAEWGGAGSLDEKMIADLRAWRDQITPAPSGAERSAGHPYSVQIRLEELDALLAAVADRDALKREACEMPDEGSLASVRLAPVVSIVNGRRLRDVATEIDAARESDEQRVIAWDQIAAHPLFRDCYGTEGSLLDAMLAKLTASTFTAEIPAEVRERAGEPAHAARHGHPGEPCRDRSACYPGDRSTEPVHSDEIRERSGEPAMRTPGVCSRCGERLYYSVPSHAWVHSGAMPKGCVPRPTPKTRS